MLITSNLAQMIETQKPLTSDIHKFKQETLFSKCTVCMLLQHPQHLIPEGSELGNVCLFQQLFLMYSQDTSPDFKFLCEVFSLSVKISQFRLKSNLITSTELTDRMFFAMDAQVTTIARLIPDNIAMKG